MSLQAAACHTGGERSTYSAAQRRKDLERTALRSFRCARCGQLALVCRRCEHNQIYCNAGCADIARLESQRRAGARHQRTREGRRNHADRQACYRTRQLQKVTHHTPAPPAAPVQPCMSGPALHVGLPDKEDSDVYLRTLPILSLASVRTLETPPARRAATSPSSTPPRPFEEPTGHLCHFCRRTRSRYLRRDFLVDLSRRSVRRRKRSPP